MDYFTLRRRVMEILDPGVRSDLASKICDLSIMVLVLANIAAVMLESVDEIEAEYHAEFALFELCSVIFFTTEYLVRLWSNGARFDGISGGTWRGRRSYMFGFHGLVDLISILPFFAQALFPGLDLRVLRTVRLLRLFKLSHYSTAVEDLVSAIYQERKAFIAALYLLAIAVIITSSLMYFSERLVQPEKFASIPDAIYWSFITLTTVGYGDVTPVTAVGKAVALLTSFMGVCLVALLTGIVANAFANQVARRRAIFEEQVREALRDGVLDGSELQNLDKLRVAFNLSEKQAEALIDSVRESMGR